MSKKTHNKKGNYSTMNLSYIIIDDFLDNAMQLRRLALQSNFPSPEAKTNYPGKNSEKPILMASLDTVISDLVGEKLKPMAGTSHGKFRLAFENDKGEANVHIDNCHWSGILYLTLDEHCQGGTDFYRHKATQTDNAPYTEEQLKKIGLTDYKQVWDEILFKDTNDLDKWEHLMNVPMKFNRLVLFRPWLYHNAGISFGTSIDNARLIYPLFYQNI